MMEDWESQLSALNVQLQAWNRRVDEEVARLRRERRLGGLFRKPSAHELESLAIEARRRAGTEILVELAALFDAVCDRYVQALPQERAKIRARIGSHEAIFPMFWNYVEQSPARIRLQADRPELVCALTALAIHDLRADIELVDAVAGKLVLAAIAANLDWKEPFASTAKIANQGTAGGGAHMREFLAGFEQSEYFKRHVAPEMSAASREARENEGEARENEGKTREHEGRARDSEGKVRENDDRSREMDQPARDLDVRSSGR